MTEYLSGTDEHLKRISQVTKEGMFTKTVVLYTVKPCSEQLFENDAKCAEHGYLDERTQALMNLLMFFQKKRREMIIQCLILVRKLIVGMCHVLVVVECFIQIQHFLHMFNQSHV